jgi:hypothetical protein
MLATSHTITPALPAVTTEKCPTAPPLCIPVIPQLVKQHPKSIPSCLQPTGITETTTVLSLRGEWAVGRPVRPVKAIQKCDGGLVEVKAEKVEGSAGPMVVEVLGALVGAL